MEMQGAPNGFDVSNVPYEQVAVFAAVQSAGSDATQRVNPQYNELQRYLIDNLLEAPVENVKDRLAFLLRDDRYHELCENLEPTVPLQALIEMIEEDLETSNTPNFPSALHEQYTLGLELQAEVMRAWVGYIARKPKRSTRRSKSKLKSRSANVLAFMQEPMPAVLKRALLSAWTAPMCFIALEAGDLTLHTATRKVLLDEWTDGMRRQLALYSAIGAVDPPSERLLPARYRISILEVHGKFLQGYGRTLERMAVMDKISQPVQSPCDEVPTRNG